MLKKAISLIICLSFMLGMSQASQFRLYGTGLSYHIGANKSNPAYKNAPLRLDDNGAFVFNPGFGLGFDLFQEPYRDGFSLGAIGMLFKDCDKRNTYVVGLGPTYQYLFVGSWSVDLDLYLSLYRAQEWKTSTYSNSFVPFASLGVSHHWDKISLGVKFTFSPKNSAASSTADFNIIYSYVYLGIYI